MLQLFEDIGVHCIRAHWICRFCVLSGESPSGTHPRVNGGWHRSPLPGASFTGRLRKNPACSELVLATTQRGRLSRLEHASIRTAVEKIFLPFDASICCRNVLICSRWNCRSSLDINCVSPSPPTGGSAGGAAGVLWWERPTVNTTRKATGGLPSHQTPFDPHTNRYEPGKPLRTP